LSKRTMDQRAVFVLPPAFKNPLTQSLKNPRVSV
jgi:hypothetical protein